jgi:hypothetical protein
MFRTCKLKADSNTIAPGAEFRHLFILDSREWWSSVEANYDPSLDLVLTYDFGLRHQIEALGGTVRYIDHLCEQSVMQENNFRMYQFFRDWHLDEDGVDIFRYRGVDFGFSFRIEIWNDFTFLVRSRLCLEKLRTFSYKTLFVGSDQVLVGEILVDMDLCFTRIEKTGGGHTTYFFPIHRWMDERLRTRSVRHLFRDAITAVQGVAMSFFDSLADRCFPIKRVFVQEYHPTRALMRRLQKYSGVGVVQGHFSSAQGWMKYFIERPIPVYGRFNTYRSTANELLDAFHCRRSARLVLSSGVDIADAAYRVIEQRVSGILPQQLRTLDCVIRYLDKHPIELEILIANVGQLAMLVDCVAKNRGVPSYLIINGMLGNEYLDEGKYASVINAYSTSIRDNYFRGMDNIVCLGDPRMDDYALACPRSIDREAPTVTIGASGFSNIDLNSFLAVEFEFINEALLAIEKFRREGRIKRVVIKVRANGYSHLYEQFVSEYFPGIVDVIIADAPMRRVLETTDFYISICSQTLFEASCLGIPSVYHKNDREIIDPPFDGSSELVTTTDVSELEQAVADFLSHSRRYDEFLRREIMEKYIGPLDGRNLERNLSYALKLLEQPRVVQ